ncbi:MAG: hypothetical protein OER88_04365, partial [Planctomycetota bacterium]|nr:hypothetical protein [Planctomycetota bacterium]
MTPCLRLALLALLAAACSSDPTFTPVRVTGVAYGVTFSPRGFTTTMTTDDVAAFLRDKEAGPAIAFHMNWRDSIARAGEIPDTAIFANNESQTYGFLPIVGFGFNGSAGPALTSESDRTDNSWTNNETRTEFLAMVREYARRYRPQYLFLGNEINSYYLTATQPQWEAWVTMFREAYLAVKAESPATVVFTVFQYEHLKGLGVKNGWADDDQWELLDDFAGTVDAL